MGTVSRRHKLNDEYMAMAEIYTRDTYSRTASHQ